MKDLKKIKIGKSEILVPVELAKLYDSLDSIPDVGFIDPQFHITFSHLFARRFLENSKYFVYTTFINRSNWTQITANSFLETCKILNRVCEFEVENKHDGVIRGKNGDVELCAEWEYITDSIFGAKGEIVKIFKTQKKFKSCEAILFTYVEVENYSNFISKVYEEYNKLLLKRNKFRIVIMAALLEKIEDAKSKCVDCIRIVEIGRDYIDIFGDII